MKKITVEIPDELAAWLHHEAQCREITVPELVRDAIVHHRSRGPIILRAAGAGTSGETDISQRIEELIAAEWGRE